MKKLGTLLAASAIAATALALTATSASARVVCNAEGDCWHVRNNYNYQPGFGLVVHEDNWRWNTNERAIAGVNIAAVAIGATAYGYASSQFLEKRR